MNLTSEIIDAVGSDLQLRRTAIDGVHRAVTNTTRMGMKTAWLVNDAIGPSCEAVYFTVSRDAGNVA